MKMYNAEGLDQLIDLCQQHQLICIADEVMTGFGRTGKLFASAWMKHQPDIICLSKGLTGGTLPLSITACSAKVYEAFVEEDLLKTFSTDIHTQPTPSPAPLRSPAWTFC